MLRSSQPSVKENPSFSPLLQVSAHGRTGVRPLSAFLGQRQISFGQFRSAGIDQVEDFYHDIDALSSPVIFSSWKSRSSTGRSRARRAA
jgi:hypothetical protein